MYTNASSAAFLGATSGMTCSQTGSRWSFHAELCHSRCPCSGPYGRWLCLLLALSAGCWGGLCKRMPCSVPAFSLLLLWGVCTQSLSAVWVPSETATTAPLLRAQAEEGWQTCLIFQKHTWRLQSLEPVSCLCLCKHPEIWSVQLVSKWGFENGNYIRSNFY